MSLLAFIALTRKTLCLGNCLMEDGMQGPRMFFERRSHIIFEVHLLITTYTQTSCLN